MTLRLRALKAKRIDTVNAIRSGGVPLAQEYARGAIWLVDTANGSDGDDGVSWANALKTMSEALNRAQSYDTICFVGDVREELTGDHEVFDLTIVGMSNRPRHPNTGYNGAATWRPPVSPTTATPLITVRAQGWRFANILFDCPVDAAAIYLERNAEDGPANGEYDASHASILDCPFDSGLVGIQNAGGCGFVEVRGNRFLPHGGQRRGGQSNTSILPSPCRLNWQIEDNDFNNNASQHNSQFDELLDDPP